MARAVEILRALGESPGGMTLVQIAEESGLPRSTVHRIVHTLQEANFVTAGARGGGLRLGPELARIAAVSRAQLVPLVRPFLEQLSRTVGQGASLAILDGENVRFLDQAVTGHGIRAISLVGSTFPAHCTANGKALLAALDESVVPTALPRRLPRLTRHTITGRADLMAELERVRATGVAFDREEHAEGICAVGRVIRDAVGNHAAITVALPSQSFYGREDELVAALTETTERVNEVLAYAR
ncbi:IclR family transcriptional regulator [Streptomyces sp. NPDC090493]|uniref:IclR family transcriptional regulator n=1 Tax=Streptomyces sp. NPDC090493 TaxID=3365964 RepID=UPI0037FA9725